jgi:lycopene beta-cyclase
MNSQDRDIAILGGGLAGGLIALALAKLRPDLRVTVIERGERLGGHHVWSFFASDVAPADAWLVEPLIAARWDGYSVRFPGHERTLATPYRSVVSERLDAVLRATLPADRLLTGTSVIDAGQTHVVLASGRALTFDGVIDARGQGGVAHMRGGWQTFLGQTLRLERPHGLSLPLVMDATVAQHGAYRFVYCLPFSQTQVFVEDTYYTEDATIDATVLRDRIAKYAQRRGWRIAAVEREETGALPVIGAGNFAAFWPSPDSGPARAGVRAGLAHPMTSYSLPDAVRFATHIARLPNLSGAALATASYDWSRAHWRQGNFYRMLTRMLFGAGQPHHRFRMLERFYRLPEPLIERFYAGRSTRADMLRLLAGKPPVPVLGALASLAGKGRPLDSHLPGGPA